MYPSRNYIFGVWNNKSTCFSTYRKWKLKIWHRHVVKIAFFLFIDYCPVFIWIFFISAEHRVVWIMLDFLKISSIWTLNLIERRTLSWNFNDIAANIFFFNFFLSEVNAIWTSTMIWSQPAVAIWRATGAGTVCIPIITVLWARREIIAQPTSTVVLVVAF